MITTEEQVDTLREAIVMQAVQDLKMRTCALKRLERKKTSFVQT